MGCWKQGFIEGFAARRYVGRPLADRRMTGDGLVGTDSASRKRRPYKNEQGTLK
jgi:hypothetical protein